MADSPTPPPALLCSNLLDTALVPSAAEAFDDILRAPGVRIERIVSFGQTTPMDQPYIQDWDEWVLILSGTAVVAFDGKGEHRLTAGDHLHIPANQPHFVVHTDKPTIWLAVHMGER